MFKVHIRILLSWLKLSKPTMTHNLLNFNNDNSAFNLPSHDYRQGIKDMTYIDS